MNYYLMAFQKYAQFKGRSSSSELWYFILIHAVILIILSLIEGSVLDQPWLSAIYQLATLLPLWTVIVRRLHDVGKNGWWILIDLVPIIGFFWLLVLLVKPSQPTTNEYGPAHVVTI